MNGVVSALVVLAIWAAAFFGLYWTVALARRWYHLRGRRNPLRDNLLRGPGHTVGAQREEYLIELMAYVAVVPAVAVVFYAMYLSRDRAASLSAFTGWLYLSAGLVFFGFAVLKTVSIVKRLRDTGLGFEAESAVGQELNWLMRDGFSVFHDVPGDKNFNIDHVVVGRQGTFAVETKGRSKPMRKNEVEYVVEHINGELVFPGWKETAPLEQARMNANWLAKWLTSAVGTPVTVKPVLAIPGWWIERKSPSDVAIVNGKNTKAYFTKTQSAELSEQLVRQIVHQLDGRCRDVEPRVYKPAKDD